MMRKAAVLFALLLFGCHESLGLVGDARMDHSAEPPVDAPVDVLVDVIHDADADPFVDPSTDPDTEGPCPPPWDEEVLVDFSLDDDRFLEYDLTLVCTTEEYLDDPATGTVNVWLSCRSDEGTYEEHHLYFQYQPFPPIPVWLFLEGELHVRYAADPVFWFNRWLTVHSIANGFVIAAVSAETVAPPGHEDWYEPLEAWRVGGRCPPEDGWCGTLEREAIEVVSGDMSVVTFDGTMGLLEDADGDSYSVLVSAAHHYRYIECEDVPIDWVQALIVPLP
jgi:hypothetical protein